MTELHDMDGGPFLEVVRKDVIEQPPTPELEHPLILDSWREALEKLRIKTQTTLGEIINRNFEFGKRHLPVQGWDPDKAQKRFELLDFLVRTHGRWCDQRYLTRRFSSDINRELDERVNPLRKAAQRELLACYPDELAAFRTELADSSSAGTMPPRRTVPLPPGTPTTKPSTPPRPPGNGRKRGPN